MSLTSTPNTKNTFRNNLIRFTFILRHSGIKTNPQQVILALKIFDEINLSSKKQVYDALLCVFITKKSDIKLFQKAFDIFWSLNLNSMFNHDLDKIVPRQKKIDNAQSIRNHSNNNHSMLSSDASITNNFYWPSISSEMMHKDFEKMSEEEIEKIKNAFDFLDFSLLQKKSRRFEKAAHGAQIFKRKTIQQVLKYDGNIIKLYKKRNKIRPQKLVFLCDISKSMEAYSRIFLYFINTLFSQRKDIECFVFSTDLTRISPLMTPKNAHNNINMIPSHVKDWSGGTRISFSLKKFNYEWARRVLAQGATVILFTDGLERGDTENSLGFEMERLSKSSNYLIWLNPLLRYENFEIKASGIKAMQPFVDLFLPLANLKNFLDFYQFLGHKNVAKSIIKKSM